MKHCWWLAIVLLAAFDEARGSDTKPNRISPDAAAAHLKSSSAPDYPPFALTARIQGNVILHILIDEKGNTSPWRVVTGHPMLVSAAMKNVTTWKFLPFTVEGRPVSVITVARVRFGNPTNHDADDEAEVNFEDKFWTAFEKAESAFDGGDLAATKKGLADAESVLSGAGDVRPAARWQWLTLTGDVYRREKKLPEAEQHYREALELQKKYDREGPRMAALQLALGRLYFESNKMDLAQEWLSKAASAYRKNSKDFGDNPKAKEVFARAIIDASWMLSRIAFQQGKQEQAIRHCRDVVEQKKSLSGTDRNVEECEGFLSTAKAGVK